MQQSLGGSGSTARRSNKQRSDETRAQLIAAARELFLTKGYADTGTPEIVASAQVTRGALYHHFNGKQALFFSVVLQAADEVASAIHSESSGAGSALENILSGANAYFSAMAEQDRAQLLLLQAPAILDTNQLRQLSDAAGSAELKEGLLSILPSAKASDTSIDALTMLVSAAFDRAAQEIAHGASRESFERAIKMLLQALART